MASSDAQEAPLKSSTYEREYKSSFGLVADVALRVLLFATALAAIIVMVTSEQTKMIPVAPGKVIARAAKFNHSPAFM